MYSMPVSVGQSVAYYLVLMACRLVAIWPDCVLFGVFRPILTFVVYRVARYRVAVVRDNLSKSFPEKSTEELRQIERKFYRNFAELLLASGEAERALAVIRSADFPAELARAEAILETRALEQTGRTAESERRWKRYLASKKGERRSWI